MYSLTQGGNLAVVVGLIVMVFAHFKITLVPEEVTQVVMAIGVIVSWFGRYRQGDVTVAGFKK